MGRCVRDYSGREIDCHRFVNFLTPVRALSGEEAGYNYEGAKVMVLRQELGRFRIVVHTNGFDEEAREILSGLENAAYASLILDSDPSMLC